MGVCLLLSLCQAVANRNWAGVNELSHCCLPSLSLSSLHIFTIVKSHQSHFTSTKNLPQIWLSSGEDSSVEIVLFSSKPFSGLPVAAACFQPIFYLNQSQTFEKASTIMKIFIIQFNLQTNIVYFLFAHFCRSLPNPFLL